MAYEYFTDAVDPAAVRELWRHEGQQWEYLSLIDWSWHPADERVRPPADAAPISGDQSVGHDRGHA